MNALKSVALTQRVKCQPLIHQVIFFKFSPVICWARAILDLRVYVATPGVTTQIICLNVNILCTKLSYIHFHPFVLDN